MIGGFEGVEPGLHALKIHEFGDLEYGCDSVGDVFNPFGAQIGHSHLDLTKKRVGDLEQVQARFDENAEYKNRDRECSLWGPNSIMGRAMVLYEREDDHDEFEHPEHRDHEGKIRDARFREGVGHPIACCVIGRTKKPVEEPKKEEERLVDKREREKAQVHPQQLFGHQEGFRNFQGGFEGHQGGFGGNQGGFSGFDVSKS